MKGLPTNITLNGGKFLLVDGVEKARDRMWFLMNFDKLRIYLPDFNPGLTSLIQRTISYVTQYKPLFLGKLTKLVGQYVPEVAMKSTDVIYSYDDRKSYAIFVEYNYIPEAKAEIAVTFV